MALNIVARRRVSLKGFAEGWDACYLIVKGLNKEELEAARSQISDDTTDEEGMRILRDQIAQIILGGVVIDTKDDGTTESVNVTPADGASIVDALGAGWLQEVMTIASGADRLKV